MRDVQPAVRRHRLRDFDQFFGAGEIAGRVYQRGSETERTVLHGVAQRATHRVERRADRGAHAQTHAVLAQRTGAHERADVGRDAVGFHRAQPCIEATLALKAPRRCDRGWSGRRQIREREVADGCGGIALAQNLRRDALRELAHVAAIAGEVRATRLNVDEARRDDFSRRVDAAACQNTSQHSTPYHSHHAVAANRDVAIEPGIPAAVDHLPIHDDDIERRLGGHRVRALRCSTRARGGGAGNQCR